MSLPLACGVMFGCAAKPATTHDPRPGSGIAEYRHVVTDARQAMHAALKSLATVSAQSNSCPPKILGLFSAQMQRLQVESIQLRARAQAIQARGDAYFEHWQEHLARLKDPRTRAGVEMRRPEFEQHFRRIKLLTAEVRQAFDPFQSTLRTIRNRLESDPASLSAGATQNLIVAANENGRAVEAGLAGIIAELDSMRALLATTQRNIK